MVSDVDVAVEEEIRRHLADETPEIGFYGEERGASGDEDLVWVLDPIDGTADFVRGLPLCGVSLALVKSGEPVLGIIEMPFMGRRYEGAAGHGAHSDGRVLTVSDTRRLQDAIVSIGDYGQPIVVSEKAPQWDRPVRAGDTLVARHAADLLGAAMRPGRGSR